MSLWSRLFKVKHERHDEGCLDDSCAEERLENARDRVEQLERRARELEFEVNIQTYGRRHDDPPHRY